MALRVLVADADEVFRRRVKKLLRGEASVVAEAATGQQAVRLALAHQPDVVLIDIDLPEQDGISATRFVKAKVPNAKVALLTSHDEDAYLSATGKSGADAFLPKRLVRTELVAALRAIAAGRSWAPFPEMERRRERLRPPAAGDWEGMERRRQSGGA